jgi:hypothetical protein
MLRVTKKAAALLKAAKAAEGATGGAGIRHSMFATLTRDWNLSSVRWSTVQTLPRLKHVEL